MTTLGPEKSGDISSSTPGTVCDQTVIPRTVICFFFIQVSARDESNSSMGGYLWLRVRKKDWKRMWYRIKEKVLYTYKASEDVVALSSTPLLGYAVCVINEVILTFILEHGVLVP